ncbi:hypothetical protein [Halorussus sp. AFM4]|uniref:hypothetical protein n=1 Tax=Halorussus sp. AFM4 TaxID=3421651 RepID=UPI003EBF190B
MTHQPPNLHDDTSTDYKRFERRQITHDQDCNNRQSTETFDAIDESQARQIVLELLECDIAIPVEEEQVLYHEPSGKSFKSDLQLAVFHKGWTAREAADE